VELRPLGPGDSILVRLPDGQDLVSSLAGVESLVEGELWKTTVKGARLPAELAPGPAFPAERDSALTPDHWRSRNSSWELQECQVWKDEAVAGQRLFEVEKREGQPGYPSRELVLEKRVAGFTRAQLISNICMTHFQHHLPPLRPNG
jgi:hypothetical protein